MFLKKIALQNFKCLEDIELSFEKTKTTNRKWTLILGENGTGKSNLLKAIALITSGSNALGELLGESNSWIKVGKDSCKISATLTTKNGEERNIFLQINKDQSLSDIILANQVSLSLIDNAIQNADRNYFVVAYGASRRLSSESFNGEKRGHGRSNNIRNLFFNSHSLNPLANWIIDLDYESGDQGLQMVKDSLNGFLPGTTFDSIDKRRREVLFRTADGLVPLNQLSDGYQNMAAWIGDVLFRVTETFRNYTNPLEARGLLLIDEIDLHLHPKWQRMLIEFIGNRLPNFQVVATTHSPLTAQQTDVNELYALKRESDTDRISILPFVGSPKTLLVNQLLMTPVFGLDTDESLEVETTKMVYDEYKSQYDMLNDDEKMAFEKAKIHLQSILPQRDMSPSAVKELALLQKIERHLNSHP